MGPVTGPTRALRGGGPWDTGIGLWGGPKYHMIYQEGPPHKRTYIMGVGTGSEEPMSKTNIRENCIGFGIGTSKKEGEQNAAKMALILYGYAWLCKRDKQNCILHATLSSSSPSKEK